MLWRMRLLLGLAMTASVVIGDRAVWLVALLAR